MLTSSYLVRFVFLECYSNDHTTSHVIIQSFVVGFELSQQGFFFFVTSDVVIE